MYLFRNIGGERQPLWILTGAPQKIMYIAEEAFKKAGVKANIQYHTALPGATFPA